MRVPPRLRPLTLVLGLVSAILAAGCQVRTDVELSVDRDGSGTVAVEVTLDRQAAAQVPDLARQLRVDDLRRAGWRLAPPRRAAGGGLRVLARKRFGRPEQAGAVVEELAGRDGPFRGVAVNRTHSFARTAWTLRGTVDLHRGLAAFSDPRVTALLGGLPVGRSAAELRLLTNRSLADAAPFRVRVRLPGQATRTYDVRFGDRPLPIDAHASATNANAYRLGAGAVIALVAALVLLVRQGRRRGRPRQARRGMGAYDRRRYQPITEVEDGPPPGTGGTPKLVQVRRPPPAPQTPRPAPPEDDPGR